MGEICLENTFIPQQMFIEHFCVYFYDEKNLLNWISIVQWRNEIKFSSLRLSFCVRTQETILPLS